MTNTSRVFANMMIALILGGSTTSACGADHDPVKTPAASGGSSSKDAGTSKGGTSSGGGNSKDSGESTGGSESVDAGD